MRRLGCFVNPDHPHHDQSKSTMQMKCPAWFHWRRRRVIARRVIHCPVNWIMQDHAAFFIFHIITIIIIVIIIIDDSSPLRFRSSSMKRTKGKSPSAKHESALLQNVNWIVFEGSYTHISFPLPYYSPSLDSFFGSHHFCCLDVIILVNLNHRKHKSSPRSARTTSMWTGFETMLFFEEGLT